MAKLPKIHLPFFTGLDTGKDPLATPSRTMAELRNVRFDKAGAIVKRPGYEPIHDGLLVDDVHTLAGNPVPVAVCANGRTFSLGDSETRELERIGVANMTRTVLKAVTPSLNLEWGGSTGDNTNLTATGPQNWNAHRYQDKLILVWTDVRGYVGGTYRYAPAAWQVFHYPTLEPLTDVVRADSAWTVHGYSASVVVGDRVHIYYLNASDGIDCVHFDIADPTNPSRTTQILANGDVDVDDGDWVPLLAVDSGVMGGANYAWVVVRFDGLASDSQVKLVRVTEAGAVSATSSASSFTSENTGLACAYSETNGVATWNHESLKIWDASALTVSTNTDAGTLVTSLSNHKGVKTSVVWDGDDLYMWHVGNAKGTTLLKYSSSAFSQVAILDFDGFDTAWPAWACTQPWKDSNGEWWGCLNYANSGASNLGEFYHVVGENRDGMAASLPPSIAFAASGSGNPGYANCTNIYQEDPTKDQFEFLIAEAVEGSPGGVVFSWCTVKLNADATMVVAADGYNVASGIPLTIHHNGVCEGSPVSYDPILFAAAAGSGVSLTNGAHNVKVVYRVDMPNGDIMYSAESPAVTVTTTGTQYINTQTEAMGASYQYENASIVVYHADLTTGIYHISDILNMDVNGASLPRVTFNIPNDVNTTNPQTFYGPLEVQAVNPGNIICIASGNDRLWAASEYRVYYSKLVERGIQPAFSDALFIDTGTFGGTVRGVGFVGDTAIILKERAVYAVAGDGPDNNGAGGFSSPRLVHPSVGCANPRSVVQTPAGLIWLSEKGFYALTNNFQVSYVGEPVEDYNQVNVTSAWCVPGTNEVRWLTSDGVQLVFNYEHGVWSTDDVSGASAVVAGDTYHIGTGRQVLAESEGVYTDNGTFYPMVAEYNWVKLDRLASEVSWRNLEFQGFAEQSGDITVRVTVWYDFDEENVGDTWDITWADCVPGKSLTFTKRLRKPKSRAVKIRFEELNPNGAGLSFSSCALQFKQYGGRGRFPASRKPRST